MNKHEFPKCQIPSEQFCALERCIHKEVQRILAPSPSSGPAPLMKALRTLGISTVFLADYLGVGQSTAASYMNGIRNFPAKHEQAAYSLLECAIEVAENQRSEASKTIPSPEIHEFKEGLYQANFSNAEKALDAYGQSILECEELLNAWEMMKGAKAAFQK